MVDAPTKMRHAHRRMAGELTRGGSGGRGGWGSCRVGGARVAAALPVRWPGRYLFGMEVVSLGVIGCGAISGAYLGMSKVFPHVRVAAVADLDAGRAAA